MCVQNMLTLPSAPACTHTPTSALGKMREQTPDRCLVMLLNTHGKYSGAEFRNRRKAVQNLGIFPAKLSGFSICKISWKDLMWEGGSLSLSFFTPLSYQSASLRVSLGFIQILIA